MEPRRGRGAWWAQRGSGLASQCLVTAVGVGKASVAFVLRPVHGPVDEQVADWPQLPERCPSRLRRSW